MNTAKFTKLSSGFLIRVLESLFTRLGGDHVVNMDENWCDFHEHENEVEREECERVEAMIKIVMTKS
jgi:hypothetical protein